MSLFTINQIAGAVNAKVKRIRKNLKFLDRWLNISIGLDSGVIESHDAK
jgi:hypothetical protein